MINSKSILLILLVNVGVVSCKKDKLKDEKSILIGNWEWVNTQHDFGWCEGESWEETLTPESEDENYSMFFYKKGVVEFYQNGNLLDKSRVVFDHFEINELGNFSFVIDLNNKEENRMSGYGNETSVNFGGFPFVGVAGCEDYDNYFSKG